MIFCFSSESSKFGVCRASRRVITSAYGIITLLRHSMCIYTVQLNLNLTLACTVPTSKNTRSACAQPGPRVFADLHANGNPLHVTRERTVHEDASLGKRYTPASMSNMQVTRVHVSKKGDTQVHLPLSIGALWYLRGINHHSIGLFTR